MAQHVNMPGAHMPGALPSVPGFSEQQVHGLINIVHSIMQQYFASQYQPSSTPPSLTPPSSTPPAPQETHKEEDEQLLQQATVENITESTTKSTMKHGSSMPDSQSTLSTIPRLCTARSSGDSAACLSKALPLACQQAIFLNTLLGYFEYPKGIEATGQG